MRKTMTALALALLLCPAWASADFIRYYPPAGVAWDGGAFTTPATGPTGCANPAYSFSGDATTGLCRTSVGIPALVSSGFIFLYGNNANVYTNYPLLVGANTVYDRIVISPVALGATTFDGTVTSADLTAARTWTVPDATGDVAVIASTGFPVRTGAQAWSTRCLAAGIGVTIAEACGQAGNITVGIDTAIVNTFSSGTGDVPATGAIGTSYAETDANSIYDYPSTDTEHWRLTIAAGQTAGRLFQTSATDVLAEITPTDDTILISNGSTWEKKTASHCPDSGGNHWNYDNTTNTISCGTSGGGAFDPSTSSTLFEDFISGIDSASGTVGATGWYFSADASGTGAWTPGIADHPGLLRINSHATNDNSGGSYNLQQSGLNFASLGTNDWTLDAVVKVGSNGTALTSAVTFFGLATASFGTGSGGAWIRYDSDRTDATFIFQICNASGATGCSAAGDDTSSKTVASTITPVAGTWYRLRIRRADSGVGGNPTWYFAVNNETEKTFCSATCDDTLATLPASGAYPTLSYGTRTTTGVLSGDLDYVYFTMSGLSRY